MALTYSYNVPTNSYYVLYNSCTAGAVVIPSTYNDGVNGVKPVGGINDGAFSGCTSITSIVIPNSVTYLGDAAFDGCTNLSSVTIGTGVTGFYYLLFQNCTSLINLTVPSNILIINAESFYGCLNLTNINIDPNNPNYTSVDGVVFNKNITTLVLYPIGKIGSYSIPNTVTSIGSESFLNCTNLTNITIPDSVTSILYYAFAFCTGLTSITIPNSVTSIGDAAFINCTNVNSVTISNNITSITSNVFRTCSSLTSLIIPNKVTSIGDSVFLNCTSLARVTIPNSVTSIGISAFNGCTNLNNITIPKNVTTINNQTFANCSALTRINFLGNAPSLGTTPFLNANVNLKFYRYSTKSGWSSTLDSKDVLLIDSGTRGLRSFGFGASSSGQASVKKTNVGSGRLTLSKFDPRNISNIESWTSQGSLSDTSSYNIAYVEYSASYSGNDIDTVYYPDDNTYSSYTGESFGFTIVYSGSQGVWFLYDPNLETDIAYAEDLLAGVWFTYGDLEYFEAYSWDYDGLSSTDLRQYTWSDISGKSNNLITRPNPRIDIVSTNNLNNLERKILNNATFRTNSSINFINPFTIYIVLSDAYVGSNTRRIFGMDSFPNAGPTYYSQLYLESTSSGINHIFTLKFFNFNGSNGFTTTICSITVFKVLFSLDAYGPSILKLSSNYDTTSGSPVRRMTLNYYNKYSDINKTLGSLSSSGLVTLNSVIPNQWLYLGYSNFGSNSIIPTNWLYLSEFLMYSKFLNATEDGSINRYLQRKYYGKLLS